MVCHSSMAREEKKIFDILASLNPFSANYFQGARSSFHHTEPFPMHWFSLRVGKTASKNDGFSPLKKEILVEDLNLGGIFLVFCTDDTLLPPVWGDWGGNGTGRFLPRSCQLQGTRAQGVGVLSNVNAIIQWSNLLNSYPAHALQKKNHKWKKKQQ